MGPRRSSSASGAVAIELSEEKKAANAQGAIVAEEKTAADAQAAKEVASLPRAIVAEEKKAAGVPLTFCPRALRWRNPQTGKFVKFPSASLLTPQERAFVRECKAAAAVSKKDQ